MAIPGILTLEEYNPVTQTITQDAAVDIPNLLLILKEKPKDTIPSGGTLSIQNYIFYAYGYESNATIANQLSLALNNATDGIRELLIRDESIPDSTNAEQYALSELNRITSHKPISISFSTNRGIWKPYTVFRFIDALSGIDAYLTITSVRMTVISVSAVQQIIKSDIEASVLIPQTSRYMLARLLAAVTRPVKRLPAELEA